MHDDDEERETPPAVTAAAAAGTFALPFLAVYAVMFIVHGGLHHVSPPDVGGSDRNELWIGFLCLALLIGGGIALVWMLNARRRWPFVLFQALFLAASIDFLLDSTKGGPFISALVMLGSAAALILTAHPQSWEYLGQRCPVPLARMFGRRPPPRPKMPAGSMATTDDKPTSARLIGRRRQTR